MKSLEAIVDGIDEHLRDREKLEAYLSEHTDVLSEHDLRDPSMEAARAGSESVLLLGKLYALSDLPDNWVRPHLSGLITETLNIGSPDLGRELYETLNEHRPPAVTDELFRTLVDQGYETLAFDLFNKNRSAVRTSTIKFTFEEMISPELATPLMEEVSQRIASEGEAASEQDAESIMTKLSEAGNTPVAKRLLDQFTVLDPVDGLDTAVKYSDTPELVEELLRRIDEEDYPGQVGVVEPETAKRAIKGGADGVVQTLFDYGHVPSEEKLSLIFSTDEGEDRYDYASNETVRQAIKRMAEQHTAGSKMQISPLAELLQSSRPEEVKERGVELYADRYSQRLNTTRFEVSTELTVKLIEGQLLGSPGKLLAEYSDDDQKAIINRLGDEACLDLMQRSASYGHTAVIDHVFEQGPFDGQTTWHVGEEFYTELFDEEIAGEIALAAGVSSDRYAPITHDETVSLHAMAGEGTPYDETRYLRQDKQTIHGAIRVALQHVRTHFADHLREAQKQSDELFGRVRDAAGPAPMEQALGREADFDRVLELVRAGADWPDDRNVLKRAIEHNHFTLADELLERDYQPSAQAFYETFQNAHSDFLKKLLQNYSPNRGTLVRAVNMALKETPSSAPKVLSRVQMINEQTDRSMDWQFDPGQGSSVVSQPPLAFIIEAKRDDENWPRLPLLKRLVDSGVKPGENAYEQALSFDDRDCLRVLLQGDPDPDYHDLSVEAIKQGAARPLRLLVGRYTPDDEQREELYGMIRQYAFDEEWLDAFEVSALIQGLAEQDIRPSGPHSNELLRQMVEAHTERSSWQTRAVVKAVRLLVRGLNQTGRLSIRADMIESTVDTPLHDVFREELRERQVKGLDVMMD